MTPNIFGVAALFLLAAASFYFAFEYSQYQAHAAAEAAAAAAAVETKPDPFENISIEGKSAIVIDLASGKTLYEKGADAQLPLASITKVPLVLAVAEVLPLESSLTIPYDTPRTQSAEGLKAGEKWKVIDLINYTLVASSNEGADILAAAANPTIRAKYPEAPQDGATIWRMNMIAKEIGMQNTYFLNDNGLDLSTTQSGAYASARDVAKLFAYVASTSPSLFAGTAKNDLLITDESGKTASATNTNEALGEIPGLILGKTGYTDLAGGNLAVVFDVGLAHPVVAVVMGSSHDGRFSDMKTLVETARRAVTQ